MQICSRKTAADEKPSQVMYAEEIMTDFYTCTAADWFPGPSGRYSELQLPIIDLTKTSPAATT